MTDKIEGLEVVASRVWIGDPNGLQYVYSEDGDGEPLITLASAQEAVAALEETVRQLNHALRDATEAPTFMGEPTTNELVAPLVRSQYQHKRAQDRITQLEAALSKILWLRPPGGSPNKFEYEVEVIARQAIVALDSVGVTKT